MDTDPDEITNDDRGIPDPDIGRLAFDAAVYEALVQVVAGRELPPGLFVRIDPPGSDEVQVLSRDTLIGTFSRSAVHERARQLAAQYN
jgi:hypothetical protein